MFVTEVLHGKPYQSYIPAPMVPVIASHYVAGFAELDRMMQASVDARAFDAAAVASLAQDNARSLLGGGAMTASRASPARRRGRSNRGKSSAESWSISMR